MGAILDEEVRPGIRLLTLNRPDRLNALTEAALQELYDTFEAVGHDPDCRVVVLTGSGRGFCAGHDTKEAGDTPEWLAEELGPVQRNMAMQKHWAQLVPRMRAVPQPIVAAVNGPVAGGGYPLALGADVRVGAESAVFVDAFLQIGASGCEMGMSYLLPRIVGFTRAAELLLTGRRLEAAEAERIGLLVRVVPDGEVVDAALGIGEQIARNTPFGVSMTKATMWSNLETTSLEAAIDLEARTQILALQTEDATEQATALRERREPRYRNR